MSLKDVDEWVDKNRAEIPFITNLSTKSGLETGGLGLRSMRNTIQKAGGNLTLESIPGGTRVLIRLPIAED